MNFVDLKPGSSVEGDDILSFRSENKARLSTIRGLVLHYENQPFLLLDAPTLERIKPVSSTNNKFGNR